MANLDFSDIVERLKKNKLLIPVVAGGAGLGLFVLWRSGFASPNQSANIQPDMPAEDITSGDSGSGVDSSVIDDAISGINDQINGVIEDIQNQIDDISGNQNDIIDFVNDAISGAFNQPVPYMETGYYDTIPYSDYTYAPTDFSDSMIEDISANSWGDLPKSGKPIDSQPNVVRLPDSGANKIGTWPSSGKSGKGNANDTGNIARGTNNNPTAPVSGPSFGGIRPPTSKPSNPVTVPSAGANKGSWGNTPSNPVSGIRPPTTRPPSKPPSKPKQIVGGKTRTAD